MKVDRNSQQSFGGGQEKQSSLYNKDKSKEEENVDEDKSNRKKVELKVRKFKKKKQFQNHERLPLTCEQQPRLKDEICTSMKRRLLFF